MSDFDNKWVEVWLKPRILFTQPLRGTPVVGRELAEEAEELAQTEKIEFGEAMQRVQQKGQPKVLFTPPLPGSRLAVVGLEFAEEAEGLLTAGAIEIVATETTRGNAETRPT